MINNVVLVGRLTKKPELRQTSQNVSVCQFTVAVNRNFNAQNGQQEADFISCVAWRSTADNMARYLDKGSLVGIEGRIQTRTYEQDGQRRYVTEVVADNVRFLESRNNNNNQQNDNYNSSNNYQQQGYNNNYNNSYNSNNNSSYQSNNYNNASNNMSQAQNNDPFSNRGYEKPIQDNDNYVNPFKSSMDFNVDDSDLPF